MWAKLTTALKPRQDSSQSGDVMAGVYEQHPNLSVFHNDSAPFRRNNDSQRSASPMKLPAITKKVKSTFGIHGNSSQLSVGPSTPGPSEFDPYDISRPSTSQGKRRSSFNILRRGSNDELRQPDQARSLSRADERPGEPVTPFEGKNGSVRSILRDRNTPGTGQNVRFFSRDAYRMLSPDQSMESEYQSAMAATQYNTPSSAPPTSESFMDRLQRSPPNDGNTSSGSIPRFNSGPKSPKSRPTITEIFPSPEASEMMSVDTSAQLPPIPAPDFNLFDVSQDLDLPVGPPPGLDFEDDEGGKPMTSTPFRDKGKGKAEPEPEEIAVEVDESIFHSQEKSPRLPPALHDRSNSFSLGQTLFYSMAHGQSKRSSTASARDTPTSAKSSPMSANDASSASAASSPSTKSRGRALSDTVFMSMLRSPSPKQPEADINDESSSDLIVYSSQRGEPDPFSANANTYYTPQTMIPATPPDAAARATHERQQSHPEQAELIFSLQTQLALQTELCGQFETDLRARDELVEVLGKKLDAVEREEGKKRAVLKQWKKKVMELERACRLLEEEVDTSRQESAERSLMDMASGDALMSLHRQIADLERERKGWERKEDMLREEIQGLERNVREKGDDIEKLKETLATRDESERELKLGISMVKEQMEMMGNVSLGFIDENELKKIGAESTRNSLNGDANWMEEKRELVATLEREQAEKAELADEVEGYKQQLDEHDAKFKVLKDELDAQWEHAERASETIEAAETAKRELEKERDALKAELEEMNERLEAMDAELTEADQRLSQDDADFQALAEEREAMDKERDELLEKIRVDEEETEAIKQSLQASQDRILELEQERKYALDNVARLEENIRRRDTEASTYSQRVLEREAELESLREQLSRESREHAVALEDAEHQNRSSLDRIADFKTELDRLRRQVHSLQQESADKEVKIVQLNKQHSQDKQDIQGFNIALDSKQQELELIKRKMGVRGTAGATPAQPSKTATHSRRDSAIFSTPTLSSRPPSVLSDAGTDGGSGSTGKMPALSKSTRLNTSTSKPPVRAVGSMGPPPAPITKPRVSGTPTPAGPSGLSRSTSARPSSTISTSTPVAHRRVASSTLDQATSRVVKARQTVNASPAPGEKENMKSDASRPSSRARVAVPAHWTCTVVRVHGMQLMRPERSWRPIVTIEVDDHALTETLLGSDGQNVNLRDVRQLHGASGMSRIEVKVYHKAQSKKKGKRRSLVGTASGSLGELYKRHGMDPKLRLQCQNPTSRSVASKGRPQNGAVIHLRLRPPADFLSPVSTFVEEEEVSASDSEDSESSSSSGSTTVVTPVVETQPTTHLRRRRRRRGFLSDDESCSESESDEDDEKPSFLLDDDEQECAPASPVKITLNPITWVSALNILPQNTQEIKVPIPQPNVAERVLGSFTRYYELQSCNSRYESTWDALIVDLRAEWSISAAVLGTLCGLNAAIFSLGPGSLFEVNSTAEAALTAAIVASVLGLMCTGWMWIRYGFTKPSIAQTRAQDFFSTPEVPSYFFFALSARMPAILGFFTGGGLVVFLTIIAWNSWPGAVMFGCFAVGLLMGLQWFVWGILYGVRALRRAWAFVFGRWTSAEDGPETKQEC
uniref:Uncharacterized protein n=1 Tax=Mycena chlorophos TaxID=658473 RepID=A0ABQ0LGJ3_MYCCL|nr:predicted protein [Mycena chlorophos]